MMMMMMMTTTANTRAGYRRSGKKQRLEYHSW